MTEIESLRQQLSAKDEIIRKFRRAIGDHYAPNDCYATGPLTGNDFLDLVQCPACSAIEAYEEALATTNDLSGYILCEKEPAGWCGTSGVGEFIVSKSKVWNFLTTPLYRAWRPK